MNNFDLWEMEERKANALNRQRELELKLEGVVRMLAENRDGQVFLRWCMDECGVFSQSFPRDGKIAAWEAGRRAFGLQILQLCAAVNCADTLLTKEESNG